MNHSGVDNVSLSLARRVAERLRARPELLDMARTNLSCWQKRNADSRSLLRCYAEWEAILTRPLEEVCALLVAETEEGQRPPILRIFSGPRHVPPGVQYVVYWASSSPVPQNTNVRRIDADP